MNWNMFLYSDTEKGGVASKTFLDWGPGWFLSMFHYYESGYVGHMTSGATPADLLTASIAACHFLTCISRCGAFIAIL